MWGLVGRYEAGTIQLFVNFTGSEGPRVYLLVRWQLRETVIDIRERAAVRMLCCDNSIHQSTTLHIRTLQHHRHRTEHWTGPRTEILNTSLSSEITFFKIWPHNFELTRDSEENSNFHWETDEMIMKAKDWFYSFFKKIFLILFPKEKKCWVGGWLIEWWEIRETVQDDPSVSVSHGSSSSATTTSQWKYTR